MEKSQLDRREKIALGVVAAALAAKLAIEASKEGRFGHARLYPSGSFIISVWEAAVHESVRVSGQIKSILPLRIEVDSVEHTESQLGMVEKTFEDFNNQE